MGKRSEKYELYSYLFKSTSADGEYLERVLKIELEEVKDKLVKATDINTMLQLQGEAKALDKLLHRLTTAAPSD